MDITPQFLTILHRHLFGGVPSEGQLRLYEGLPLVRGFDDASLDQDRFRAVFALSIVLSNKFPKVLVLAPFQHEKWLLEQLNAAADVIFANCRKMAVPREGRITIAKSYGEHIKRIFIFGRLLQLAEEPQGWVSFGFTASDPVPDWMKPRLAAV